MRDMPSSLQSGRTSPPVISVRTYFYRHCFEITFWVYSYSVHVNNNVHVCMYMYMHVSDLSALYIIWTIECTCTCTGTLCMHVNQGHLTVCRVRVLLGSPVPILCHLYKLMECSKKHNSEDRLEKRGGQSELSYSLLSSIPSPQSLTDTAPQYTNTYVTYMYMSWQRTKA